MNTKDRKERLHIIGNELGKLIGEQRSLHEEIRGEQNVPFLGKFFKLFYDSDPKYWMYLAVDSFPDGSGDLRGSWFKVSYDSYSIDRIYKVEFSNSTYYHSLEHYSHLLSSENEISKDEYGDRKEKLLEMV